MNKKSYKGHFFINILCLVLQQKIWRKGYFLFVLADTVWIRNWLAGRLQRLVINGEESNWEELKSGVPQGSLQVLFSIYLHQ